MRATSLQHLVMSVVIQIRETVSDVTGTGIEMVWLHKLSKIDNIIIISFLNYFRFVFFHFMFNFFLYLILFYARSFLAYIILFLVFLFVIQSDLYLIHASIICGPRLLSAVFEAKISTPNFFEDSQTFIVCASIICCF